LICFHSFAGTDVSIVLPIWPPVSEKSLILTLHAADPWFMKPTLVRNTEVFLSCGKTPTWPNVRAAESGLPGMPWPKVPSGDWL
jgi:hypothetical protein